MSKASKNHHETANKQRLFFDPEDGDDIVTWMTRTFLGNDL
jgi:hypothetical protein